MLDKLREVASEGEEEDNRAAELHRITHETYATMLGVSLKLAPKLWTTSSKKSRTGRIIRPESSDQYVYGEQGTKAAEENWS